MIIISISEQILRHRRRSGVWYTYPVSTAVKGTGNRRNSFQTPLGKHQIFQKIGEGEPVFTSFVARRPIDIFNPSKCGVSRDWILTRILWLDGMETGINRRGKVDTRSRYIYIHGTHAESDIGKPTSHGCIRMRNEDIIQLFENTFEGERVLIRP